MCWDKAGLEFKKFEKKEKYFIFKIKWQRPHVVATTNQVKWLNKQRKLVADFGRII